MSELWTDDEDQIVVKGFKDGLSDREIAQALSGEGFSRTMGGVSSRRSSLRLLHDRSGRLGLWPPELDGILFTCAAHGLGPTEMSEAIAEAGHIRSPSSCSSRAERIGAYADLDCEKTVAVISDPLAEALRLHHPERETVGRTQIERSVPIRSTPDPVLSLIGSHF